MITDLVQIRRLGEQKFDENLRFRGFMKSRDHSDRILRRIAEGIQEQIDCAKCGACCLESMTEIAGRDVERLARHLGMTKEQFLADYTMRAEDDGALVLRWTEQAGCVFLEGTRCSVYEARPDDCRGFSHLVRRNGSIASRMWQFVERATYCPIVYNSLEAFKDELRFRR